MWLATHLKNKIIIFYFKTENIIIIFITYTLYIIAIPIALLLNIIASIIALFTIIIINIKNIQIKDLINKLINKIKNKLNLITILIKNRLNQDCFGKRLWLTINKIKNNLMVNLSHKFKQSRDIITLSTLISLITAKLYFLINLPFLINFN